jgi:formate-dependent phosphoribosylglycinamide formyltransferase (GAR transformylase)
MNSLMLPRMASRSGMRQGVADTCDRTDGVAEFDERVNGAGCMVKPIMSSMGAGKKFAGGEPLVKGGKPDEAAKWADR